MTINVSIVLPCYNESGNMSTILEKSFKLLGQFQDYEIILVNNGSTDDTDSILDNIEKDKCSRLKIIKIDKNIGYGHGITSGLNAASGNIFCWTHADNQTDLFDVPRGIEILGNCDNQTAIKGKRKGRGLLDRFFTYGMQLFVKLYLGVHLDDINAQPKIIYKHTYQQLIKYDAPIDFSLDLFLLYKLVKHNIKIKEIDVDFSERLHGEAKGGGTLKSKLSLTIRTFKYILQLKKTLN